MSKLNNPVYQDFLSACQTGDKDKVRALLPWVKENKNTINIRFDPFSPIVVAAQNGHIEILEDLCTVFDPQKNNAQALTSAVQCGYTDIVKMLIPLTTSRDDYKFLLTMSSCAGRTDIVNLLLPLASDEAIEEALSSVVMAKKEDMVKFLLPHITPKGGSDALMRAAETNQVNIVKLLLPVSDPKLDGSWALQSAIALGHSDVVNILFPVSDTKAVWKSLSKVMRGGIVIEQKGLEHFKGLLKIQEDKKILEKGVAPEKEKRVFRPLKKM